MKRVLFFNTLLSVAICLLTSCSRIIYDTNKNQSVINVMSLDTAYIKNKIDISDLEKQIGGKDQLVYIDDNGYKIMISKNMTMGVNQFGEKITYTFIVFPPGKYYCLYQKYDSRGNIRQRSRNYFNYFDLGEFEHYDIDGNKHIEIEELPQTKFTLDDIYTFMKRKGWVDDNGKDRDYITVIPPNEERRNWKIKSWNADRYWIECELDCNTGHIIHLVEEYRMPR